MFVYLYTKKNMYICDIGDIAGSGDRRWGAPSRPRPHMSSRGTKSPHPRPLIGEFSVGNQGSGPH